MPRITKQTMKPKAPTGAPRDAWDFTDHVSVLLFGASGTGKTTFWATFPDPILAIVCSGGGRNPEELLSVDTPENRERITARLCNTGEQVSEQLAEAASGGYKTVVLDHGTGLNMVLLREELGVEELLQKPAYSGAQARNAYSAVALRMKEILFQFLSLPCHRVVVGQEKDHNGKDSDGNERIDRSDLEDVQIASIGGDFSASIIKWLNPACSFLVQTFKRPRMETRVVKIAGKTINRSERGKGVDYCLRVGPHDRVITKFRKPKEIILPDVIVDPDFEKMMALVSGK